MLQKLQSKEKTFAFCPPKAIAFGTKFSLEIFKNLSFSKERFLNVPPSPARYSAVILFLTVFSSFSVSASAERQSVTGAGLFLSVRVQST